MRACMARARRRSRRGYVAAKTAHADASRALYSVAAELDSAELVAGTGLRIRNAVQAALVSVGDLTLEDPPLVVSTMLAAIAGVVRSTFERGGKPAAWRAVRVELKKLCRGYLEAAARGARAAPQS